MFTAAIYQVKVRVNGITGQKTSSHQIHVVQRNTDSCFSMTVVLADRLARSQLPEASDVVGRGCETSRTDDQSEKVRDVRAVNTHQ